MSKSYSEVIYRLFPEDNLKSCRNITFQITDDCCLKCSYCYQIHKGHKKMSKETAKKAVDLLFKMYDDNNENAFINKKTHGIIIDFIGGEPLMNIPIMSFVIDYFIQQCIEKNHEWLTHFRVSFASNGMLYFSDEFQEFLQKYHNFLSMTISIDGPKKIHDACRIDHEGNGSFDAAINAAKHYWSNYCNRESVEETKVTIAPENLKDFNEIADFFYSMGVKFIHANPIYEHKWTIEESILYYKELKKFADKLLKNPQKECSIFDENKNKPKNPKENNNWCGGTGAMLSFDPDGNAYPCIRYMASSLGESREPIIIGNVENGIYNTPETLKIYDELNAITRRSQSTDECFYCPIAAGCAWCSAWNYQETGSVNKRSTNICWMHRAEALANVYYWNKKYIMENSEKRFPLFLEQKYVLQIISEEEYEELFILSQYFR